jgi:hypothetical protein
MQEIDKKKRPESLFFENYRFIIAIWGIAIWGIAICGCKGTASGKGWIGYLSS